jgi:hypothetical protein
MATVEWCPICGAAHPAGELPQLCYNVRRLAESLREYVTGEDAERAAEGLLDACCEVLNEDLEDDDDAEVFDDEDN